MGNEVVLYEQFAAADAMRALGNPLCEAAIFSLDKRTLIRYTS